MRWLIAIAALLAAAISLSYWRPWSRPAQVAPQVAGTATPEIRQIATTVLATGSIKVKAGAEVRVGAELSGLVTKLNVAVGSHVREGEIIAQITPRGLSERLAQAKAQVYCDQLALEKINLDLQRSRQLLALGLIPRQQTEDLTEDERQAEAKVLKSKADLAVVESDLPYTYVRAPISGVVSSISTEQGETVAASFTTPTFATILKRDALELTAMVDETDIGSVHLGDPVTFTVDTYPDRNYHGTVIRIAPAGTILSGVVNYEVGIKIANADGLRPDMTANVTITTASRKALFLPAAAVRRTGSRAYVYLCRGNQLKKKDVVSGATETGSVEIRSGIAAGDVVALLRNAKENS